MKRMIGFMLFFIAVGMALMFFIPNEVIAFFIIVALLVIGYNLFCN